MTDTQSIQPAFSPASAPKPSDKGSNAALSSDFETFLKMLTVQMQNQDPLNPVESSEFAVQLATFSSVEQQVLTNDLLSQLLAQSGAGLTQMADWVGMEVSAPGQIEYDGTPVTAWVEPAVGADAADLVVMDGYGNEVFRRELSDRNGRIAWAGELSGGGMALHGSYVLQIESRAADGSVIDRAEAGIYSRVVEARQTSQGVILATQDGRNIPAASVSALRDP